MVEIAPFGVEAWLNKWEKSARYDISQSTIASLTMDELMNLDGHHGSGWSSWRGVLRDAQCPKDELWLD